MNRTRLYAVLVVLGAVLLHLPGHLSVRTPHGKQVLPEDGPALTRNSALAAAPGESATQVLGRAFSEPASVWEPLGEIVAETTYRPLGTSLLAVVRLAGGRDAHRVAGGVGLFLLALLAWLTFQLVVQARGPPGAALVAGLLVGASPHLGAAVGWPARLPVLGAALFGLLALHAALSPDRPGGLGRTVLAGVLAAAAGLTHELGYGAAAAVLALVVTQGGGATALLGRGFAAVGPSAVALIVRAEIIASVAGAGDPPVSDRPDVLDAAAGVVSSLLAPFLPAHVHLAPGPWTATSLARVGAIVLLVAVGFVLWRRRASVGARLGLAGLASFLPLFALAWSGGAPHAAWYVALAWPPLACGVALALVATVRRGGAPRLPAAVCAALLVASGVAATVRQSPVYRVRGAFIAAAVRADPSSALARAWQVGDRLLGAERRDVRAVVEDVHDDADAIARELVSRDGELTDAGRALRRDRAAAVTVGMVLAQHARLAAPLAGADEEVSSAPWAWRAERAALAGALLPGRWADGWTVLARCELRMGAVTAGAAALARARALAPDDPALAVEHGRALIDLSLTGAAVAVLDEAFSREAAAAQRRGEPPSRELLLVYADALSLDAMTTGDLTEFRDASELLRVLFERKDRGQDLYQVAYDLYLTYGDALVSLDRTALARTSYAQAVAVSSPESRAAEHLRWLDARLAQEVADATEQLDRAEKGEGNIANAYLALAIATARSGLWKQAEAMFASIERQQGGMNPPLRYARAVHLLATRPDRLDDALTELRAVLREDPTFADARFELAKVLVQTGELDAAAKEFERAAEEGADREWAVQAMEIHYRILEGLDQR